MTHSAKITPALLLIALLAWPSHARAQQARPDAAVWRTFAATLEAGTPIKVRLTSGQRLKATLLQVSDDAMAIQPRTRVPVAMQRVAFIDVASIEIDRGTGAHLARTIAVGVAAGAGAFVGLLLIAFATWAD